MSKRPASGASSDSPPDSDEAPFDPSRFARHHFPAGLREELIHAEKPHLDPRFTRDTPAPAEVPARLLPPRTDGRNVSRWLLVVAGLAALTLGLAALLLDG